MYAAGPRLAVAEQMEKEMGVKVRHACGKPFHIHTEIDGKRSKEECLPMYYHTGQFCCAAPACTRMFCKPAIEKTVSNAKEIEAGAPDTSSMER